MHAWVIGAGGMLGSAFVEDAQRRSIRLFTPSPVPWSDETASSLVLADDARRFADETGDDTWAIIWAAGASVVASSPEDTFSELTVLEALLDAVVGRTPAGTGAFFLTSSAGGVYAGSVDPPFDASTAPIPVSPYGRLKLAQERATADRLAGRIPLVVGRFSNLYGPQHNESKGQGLIPMLCLATMRRTSLNLYVSMDTLRDYLYVDDAAAMAWTSIESAIIGQPITPRIAVIASGEPTTVAQVIATVQNVAHRRVPLALGTHASSQHQVTDLRLVPDPYLLASRSAMTNLPSGIKTILDTVVSRVN